MRLSIFGLFGVQWNLGKLENRIEESIGEESSQRHSGVDKNID